MPNLDLETDKNNSEISMGDTVIFPYADYEKMSVDYATGTIVNYGTTSCQIQYNNITIVRLCKLVEVIKKTF